MRKQIGKREDNSTLSVKKQIKRVKEVNIRRLKRRLKKAGLIQDKQPSIWEWGNGTVEAFTRSEAKAKIKDILGQPNKRLPGNIKVVKCTNLVSKE